MSKKLAEPSSTVEVGELVCQHYKHHPFVLPEVSGKIHAVAYRKVAVEKEVTVKRKIFDKVDKQHTIVKRIVWIALGSVGQERKWVELPKSISVGRTQREVQSNIQVAGGFSDEIASRQARFMNKQEFRQEIGSLIGFNRLVRKVAEGVV